MQLVMGDDTRRRGMLQTSIADMHLDKCFVGVVLLQHDRIWATFCLCLTTDSMVVLAIV